MPPAAEDALAESTELLGEWEGSDAIMVLELYLQEHDSEGLLLLALAQFYVLAGQGMPQLLPREGPAADVGDWSRNQARLLARAESLLQEAALLRPDDSAVEYLLADVARARGDTLTAQRTFQAGLHKCTLTRSFEILRHFQALNLHAARGLEQVTPVYPEQAWREGIQGEVMLDLLISPAGTVMQIEVLASPSLSLTAAAAAALRPARFAPARVGKYPIWSWFRVPVRFSVEEAAPSPGQATHS